MRALQFNITSVSLELTNVYDIPSTDLEFVTDITPLHHLEWVPSGGRITFLGKPEDLFQFLYQLSIRYDIELM